MLRRFETCMMQVLAWALSLMVGGVAMLVPTPAVASAEQATSSKVLAFYYTWYGNPEVTGYWAQWPEGGHNPEMVDEKGLPDIGAAHHPVLGAYDSRDTAVLRQHLQWAEQADIDALISTWWGQGHATDRIVNTLLDAATETSVRFTLYYEEVPGDSPQAAIDDFMYIAAQYGHHPGYFTYEGRPVVFVYGRALDQLSLEQWRHVIETVKESEDLIFIADSNRPEWAQVFDGLHTYNPAGLVVWEANVQQAFHGIVKAAQDHGKIAAVTIIPGYDDSNIGRPSPMIVDRTAGALYDDLWDAAIESRPHWVLITSFNEWHEGTEIEPSVEHGAHYIESTRRWAQAFRQAPAKTFDIESVSLPVVVVAGKQYPFQMNVSLVDEDMATLAFSSDIPDGWSVSTEFDEDGTGKATLLGSIGVSADAESGPYTLQFMLEAGDYRKAIDANLNVVGEGDVAEGGVGIELGEPNISFGLALREYLDGETEAVDVDGVGARQTVPGVSDHQYMYFDVADEFLFEIENESVEVTVEYLDDREGMFLLQYDSHNPEGDVDGAYTNANPVPLTASGEWHQVRIKLSDARFANRQNVGSDFRLYTGTHGLIVRRVSVAKM